MLFADIVAAGKFAKRRDLFPPSVGSRPSARGVNRGAVACARRVVATRAAATAEAGRSSGLSVGANASIAEAAVLQVSFGHILCTP